MTDSILRQWTILAMIPQEPRSLSTRQIHERLRGGDYDVHKRTIERDLVSLERTFPSLQKTQDGSENLWFWSADARGLDIPGMSAQAALAFKLVEAYLQPLLPKSTLAALAPYLKRAEGVLDESGIPALAGWPDKVRIIPRGQPLIPPALDEQVLAVVYEALFRGRRFRAQYRGPNKPESSDYVFNPLGLVFREAVIYLVATLWDYADVKQFALHRMKAVALLDEPARAVEGFDLGEYIRQHEFEYPVANEPRDIELELLLERKVAPHFRETPLSQDQTVSDESDGRARLKATVPNTAQLRWWLLGFGSKVKVLKPDHLRQDLQARSRRDNGEEIMCDNQDVLNKLAR